MGLIKREYIDNETLITGKNLNDIQDAILMLEDGLFTVDSDKSGVVIPITDAAKRGFRSLNVFGKTIQDGTPTPDAPISLESVGGGGSISITVAEKNLWNGKFENIAFGSSEETGAIVTILSYPTYKSIVVPVIPGGKYSFSRGNAIWSGLYIAFTHDYPTIHTKLIFEDGNTTTYLSPYNKGTALEIPGITVPNDCYYMVVYLTNDSDTYDVTNTWYQVEAGEAVTERASHNGQTITISTPNGLPGIPVTSGGNYTDANGQQWICDEIDFARGVYVQRVGKLNVENETVYDTGVSVSGLSHNFYIIGDVYDTAPNYNVRTIPAICNKFIATGMDIGSFVITTVDNKGWSGAARLVFRAPLNINTVALFKEYVGEECYVLYQLKDEIHISLSEEELAAYAALHTYKDHTTVSNDAGAWMELEYVMDAKKYINSLMTGTILPARVE